MNGNDILRAMNGLDERFVISASKERDLRRKRPKKLPAKIAIGIAAAMIFTVPAGAAYSQFIHESTVMEYFSEGSVKYIEDKGLALNISDQNEHLRITLDTLLSDGNIGTLIMTVEALDNEGQKCIRHGHMPDLYVTDVQTEELLHIEEGGCWIIPDGTDPYTVKEITVEKHLQLDGLDTNRDYRFTFGINPRDDAECDENYVIIDNYADEISFDVSLRPNVEVVKFQSPEGNTIWLSEIGIYSNELETVKMLRNRSDAHVDIKLKLNGSFSKEIVDINSQCYDYSPERPQPFGACWFYALIDTENVKGIEIGDTLFTAAE